MITLAMSHPVLYRRLGAIRQKIYTIKSRLNAEILVSAEPVPFDEMKKKTLQPATKGVSWGRKLSCAWLHFSTEHMKRVFRWAM